MHRLDYASSTTLKIFIAAIALFLDMNRAKIRSLKEHLKMVSDYSVRKKAELSAELASLMAKISEVFKELFPTESRRIDEVQNTPLEKSLEKLKLIEGFLFDLMDQAEAQHCEVRQLNTLGIS